MVDSLRFPVVQGRPLVRGLHSGGWSALGATPASGLALRRLHVRRAFGAHRRLAVPAAKFGGVSPVVDPKGKLLVQGCVAGDPVAHRRFQEAYLSLIYRFEGGGHAHECADHDFLGFLFDDHRLYRRLASFRGDAPLGAYLRTVILPDLLKQFRAMIRRRFLDTVSFDEHPAYLDQGASHGDGVPVGNASPGAAGLLERLNADKRLLIKLLHIEDFDLDAAELQRLSARTQRTIPDVIKRIDTARAAVRSREGVQHQRLQEAESAGQWIRIYERQLARIEADLGAFRVDSPQAARLYAQRDELQRKLEKRRRQQAKHLHTSGHTVVTLPTEMLADLLGQQTSTTRSQVARLREELAALLSAGEPADAASESVAAAK